MFELQLLYSYCFVVPKIGNLTVISYSSCIVFHQVKKLSSKVCCVCPDKVGYALTLYNTNHLSLTATGHEWQTESFIHDDSFGGMEDNLGAVLVDDITKEIYIFYIDCAHPDSCSSKDVPSVMYVKSKDDGISWEPSVNVTAIAGPRNFAPGPGYGIQVLLKSPDGKLTNVFRLRFCHVFSLQWVAPVGTVIGILKKLQSMFL